MRQLLHKLLYVLLTGIVILWSTSAFAQERPSSGVLYNTREWHSMQFNCRSARDPDVMTCDMVQVAVRKEVDVSELKAKIDKALAQLPTEKPMPQEECNGISKMLAVLSGASTDMPEEGKLKLSKMPAAQRQDMVKSVTALLNHCRSPSAATVTEMVRTQHEMETRTCLVSANPFTQTFKRVTGSNNWTANDGPNGPCGAVNISRLQKDPKYPMWSYVTRKTITNPNGEWFPGASCSQLDQTEYVYDWKSEDKFTKCDYVKFGFFRRAADQLAKQGRRLGAERPWPRYPRTNRDFFAEP